MRIQGRIAATTLLLFSISSFAAKSIDAVDGEYIVKLKNDLRMTSKQSLGMQLGSYIKSVLPENHLVVVKRPSFETRESALQFLSESSSVEYVEPNYIYRISAVPNDPSMTKLWGLRNIGQADSSNSSGVSGVDIDAVRAWDVETGSANTVVAVIDTGVDYTHPDLKANIWTNLAEQNGKPGVDDDGNGVIDDIHGANFVDDKKPTGNPMDDHGHGSHCAGTIGAKGNDGKGIVGVNWNTRIMGVKFLSANGDGSLEGAILAINYATKMGAKILSNSWGGGPESEALREAIERSNNAGALFVAAAGNDSSNNDTNPSFPANYDTANVISVAAVDNKGALASFSNYGKKTVHVAAPGVNIFSSIKGGTYDSWSGTSMATPHVSGVAALVLSHEPNLTNIELKRRILATVKPISGAKNKTTTNGLVNAYFALENIQAPPDVNDPAAWATHSVGTSTAHPYANNANEEFELSVSGAKEMALYFETFSTEPNYDFVKLYNRAGVLVATLSGNNDQSFSPVIPGDYVKIVFTSDSSNTDHGFEVTKIAYR